MMKTNSCKILLATILFGLGLVNVQAQICAPAPVGLISAWSGDGNALDARSRSNGTIQNGVNYTAGKVGQAFNLAGNNGDRVLIGNTGDLQRQNFTIEAWVKRSSSSVVTNSPNPSSPDGIFFAYGQSGYAFYIQQNTNKLAFGQVGFSEAVAPTLAITDTNWHHVAVTQSGPALTAGTQTIFYLDGVADTPVGYAPLFSFTTSAAIGSRGDGQTDNIFFGAIDELAIYDRPLSAAQIQAIFNAGTAGKCKPFATKTPDDQVLWLAGDGDARDSSGNGNNGVLQNGATFQVGRVGQSFNFDGGDDQITVADNATQNGGTNLTVEAWINPTSLPHGGTILQKRTSGNSGGYVFEPTQPSGSGAPNGLQFVVMIGGVYQTLNPANVLTTNSWQHVAATYDGAFMRIYVNGVEVGNKPQTGAIDNVAAPIVIGRNAVNGVGFVGGIDEVSLYNRTLSADEIQSISNAGRAGKYKAQATVPANIAAWYPGDGNANDLQAANNGTLNGGATFANGKVGQAFALNGTTAYVSAPSTAGNDPTGASQGATMEAWVKFNQRPSDAGHSFFIISKDGPTFGASDAFHLRVDADNYIKFQWQGGVAFVSLNFSLQTGVWYHVVGTYSPTEPVCKFYLNGVFQNTGACTSTPRTPSNLPLEIGRYSGNNTTNFNGLIDEPAIYNRALTEAEIRDQYFAGIGGKYKGASVPTVANKIKAGDAEVTFTNLTTSGAIQETPLNDASLPPLPSGMSTGLTYDISTSATYTGTATICFNLQALSAVFPNLRIYHLEGGAWTNRTAASGNTVSNFCTSPLSTLSPFAVVQIAQSAASVSVGGRVLTAQGQGIGNVRVSLTSASGETRTALTNAFGHYNFESVIVGETYVLSVSAKRFSFENPTQVISVMDNVSNADFTANPQK